MNLRPFAARFVSESWPQQITAQYGRTQILEWYLNSAHFGHYAFGAEDAAQLYFGKSVTELTTFESAILAAVSDSPSLNPYDAPETALQRGRETLRVDESAGTSFERRQWTTRWRISAISDSASFSAATRGCIHQPAPHPIGFPFSARRIERGGLTIISTLDFDLQKGASCVTAFYAARLAGLPDPAVECEALRFLPALPPGIKVDDSSASAIITDPKDGTNPCSRR